MQSKGFSIFSSNPINANPYINNTHEDILQTNKNKPLSARDKSNAKNGGINKMKRPVSANPRLRASSAQHAIAAKPPPQHHNLSSPNAKKITETETANLLTFEREDLVKTIVMMKKEVRVLESVNSQLRAENQRMENEVSKQQRRIDKLLSPLMTKSGVAVLEMRKEIEKSVLVRQLKTQIQVLRSDVTEKNNEIENLLKSQKTSQVMELVAEKDEFYQEIQRLRQLLRDKTEEISREHQHREWDKNVSLNREVDLKREIERLSTGYLDLLNRLNNGTLQLPAKSNNGSNPASHSTNQHHHPASATSNNNNNTTSANSNATTSKSNSKSPVWHEPAVTVVAGGGAAGGQANPGAGNEPRPPPSKKSPPSQTPAPAAPPETTATRSRGLADPLPVASRKEDRPPTTAATSKRGDAEVWEESQSPAPAAPAAAPVTVTLTNPGTSMQQLPISIVSPIPTTTTTASGATTTIATTNNQNNRSSVESASNKPPDKEEKKAVEAEPLLCGIGGHGVGDLLEGKFQDKRRWYRCRVVAVHADTGDYDLLYEDGEQEHRVPHTRLRPRPGDPAAATTPAATTSAAANTHNTAAANTTAANTTTQALSSVTQATKKAEVPPSSQIPNSSRHDVDKKPFSESVNEDIFSVGDKVEAKFGGGIKYFPGTILRCLGNDTYDIRYEDGDEERGVAAEAVRRLAAVAVAGRIKTEKSALADHHAGTTNGRGSSVSTVKSSDDTVKSTIEAVPKYRQPQPQPQPAQVPGEAAGPYSQPATTLESPPYVAAPTPVDAGLDDYFANLSDDDEKEGDEGGTGSGEGLNFQYGGIGTGTGDERETNEEADDIDDDEEGLYDGDFDN